jgi:hypothetical protein
MKITFVSRFHLTEASSYLNKGRLNPRQVRGLNKRLCGMSDCACGGVHNAIAYINARAVDVDTYSNGAMKVI